MTPDFAAATLDTYRNALNEHHDLITEGNLGNSALCMYESLDNVDRVLFDEAMQVKGALQASGVIIQLRTFQSLMATANKAKFYDVAESLYYEATSTVGPDSSPLVEVETEFMKTLNQQELFDKCLGVYNRLIKAGAEPNEFTVSNTVYACVRIGQFETAIKVLNKWHDLGGVTTWTVSHSILQLAIAIDNFVLHRAIPLFAPENVHQDGVVFNRTKFFGTHKEKSSQKNYFSHVSSVSANSSSDSSYDHATEGATLTVNVDELQESDNQATEDVSPEVQISSSAAGTDADPNKSTGGKTLRPKVTRTSRLHFTTREERLTFFSEYLVRRVLVRIDQGFDIGLRRHRRESVAPEDVLALASGHLAMRGQLDRVLDKLQGGALEVDKSEELLAVVQRLFVCAPIQMLRYKGHWRELMGLVERMEAYRNQLPNEIFAAAVSRSVSALFDSRQESRALWQLTRHLDSLLATKETEALLLRVLHDSKSFCLPLAITALRQAGRDVDETYLVHAVRVSKSSGEIIDACRAWAQSPSDAVSEAVCTEIETAADRFKLKKDSAIHILKNLSSIFTVTPEQVERINARYVWVEPTNKTTEPEPANKTTEVTPIVSPEVISSVDVVL